VHGRDGMGMDAVVELGSWTGSGLGVVDVFDAGVGVSVTVSGVKSRRSRRCRRCRRRRPSRPSSKHRLQHKGVSAKLRIGRDELSSAQNKTRGSYTRASCLPRAIRPSNLLAPRGLIGRRGGRPAVCGPLQPRCTPAPVQPSPTHFFRGSAVQSPIDSCHGPNYRG
jgi:hypothetical protein